MDPAKGRSFLLRLTFAGFKAVCPIFDIFAHQEVLYCVKDKNFLGGLGYNTLLMYPMELKYTYILYYIDNFTILCYLHKYVSIAIVCNWLYLAGLEFLKN